MLHNARNDHVINENVGKNCKYKILDYMIKLQFSLLSHTTYIIMHIPADGMTSRLIQQTTSLSAVYIPT